MNNNYLVRLFSKDPKTKKVEFLGQVETDDSGTNRYLTLQAKAFRQAPVKCINATVVKVDKL